MNGAIGYESTAGEGSFFYIDLPISNQSPFSFQVGEKADSIQSSLINLEKKILYIEDIPANVELVRQVLNLRQDIRLLSASTALVGIELAKSEIPELILIDIHIPGMDGLTAFKKLQIIKETKDIPGIDLTADAMNGDVKRTLDIGFRDYTTKPIDVPGLLKAIDNIFV